MLLPTAVLETAISNLEDSRFVQLSYVGMASATGFEPVRAKPNGFQVHLLNHSDTLTRHYLNSSLRNEAT